MEAKRSPTPRMKTASICLFLLVFCASAAIIGLTGKAAYHARQEGQPVEVTFKKKRFDQFWPPGRKFEYDQWNNRVVSTDSHIVQLADTYAILVAGALGVAISLAFFALSMQERSFFYSFTLTGRRAHHVNLPGHSVILGLDVAVAVASITATCISWARHSFSQKKIYQNSFPTHPVSYAIQPANATPFQFYTFECWNCALYFDMQPESELNASSTARIKTLCDQGTAARAMIMVLAILMLLRLALRPLGAFLDWRRRNIEAREAREVGEKDVDMESFAAKICGNEEGSVSYRSLDEWDRSGPPSVMGKWKALSAVELPANRMSRVEMDHEAQVHEVEGDKKANEMEAGVAAAEMDGCVKC